MSKTVFVSGCYEILHAGHLEFFRQARALGDYLFVCAAGDRTIWRLKRRAPALPENDRLELLWALRSVDKVFMDDSQCSDPIWNFVSIAENLKLDIFATTADDLHADEKRAWCQKRSIEFVVLPKTRTPSQTSTTSIRSKILAPAEVPLRLDFAGGWLDVPGLTDVGGFVVNLAISPRVNLFESWPVRLCGGLGGSAADAILRGRDPFASELETGAGWQDPAVMLETGLCVWAGCEKLPRLVARPVSDWLAGKLAIRWTGAGHSTPDLVSRARNYELIRDASAVAVSAVVSRDFDQLAKAIQLSHHAQIGEGMTELKCGSASATKYAGSGWGGYAIYLFRSRESRDSYVKETPEALAVEPFDRWENAGR